MESKYAVPFGKVASAATPRSIRALPSATLWPARSMAGRSARSANGARLGELK